MKSIRHFLFGETKKITICDVIEAIENGEVDIVLNLLKRKNISIGQVLDGDMTLMHLVARQKKALPILKEFLNDPEIKKHIDIVTKTGLTPLLHSMVNENIEASMLLIKYGADYNFKFEGRTIKQIIESPAFPVDFREPLLAVINDREMKTLNRTLLPESAILFPDKDALKVPEENTSQIWPVFFKLFTGCALQTQQSSKCKMD